LAYDQIIARSVELAAEIADDHAARNTGGAHERDKGRGIVFAETAARVEQEFFHRILAEQRRAQGVNEILAAEMVECRLHHFPGIVVFTAPLFGQRPVRGLKLPGIRRLPTRSA